ncbi:hypothetical protein [Streptomyces sp. NPDC001070]
MTARMRTRPVLAGAAFLLAAASALLTGSVQASGTPGPEDPTAPTAPVGPAVSVPPVATCTVNGQEVTGASITGTEGFDEIECANGVPAGVVVSGGGGVDVITVEGGNAGTVDGGAAADMIEIDGENTGQVTGGDGGDLIDLIGDATANSGTVSGGLGDDVVFLRATDIAGTGTVTGDGGSDVCLFDPDPSGTQDCEVVV